MSHSLMIGTALAGAALLAAALLCLCAPSRCEREQGRPEEMDPSAGKGRPGPGEEQEPGMGRDLADPYRPRREAMVAGQMRDVRDPAVLAAMRAVPRHFFVPPALASSAYEDRPLLIGQGQTISQPYIVAYMTQAARLEAGSRVLEIGTGSGYQAAILAELGCEVWSIEIVPELHAFAAANLERTGYGGKVRLLLGDGYAGWPEEAPFDAILVTAAPPAIPAALKAQLAEGGRLVAPVGPEGGPQELVVLTRQGERLSEQVLFPVRFVPMVRGKGGD